MVSTLPKTKLSDVQDYRRRTLSPFRTLVTTFEDPDKIDEAPEAYGDWPEIDAPCEKSPVGQCQYSWRDLDHCMHCGRKVE